MKIFGAIKKIWLGIGEYILIISSIVVCLLILTAAVMRYVFKVNFFGSEELILQVTMWIYFIGCAAATRERSHIYADVITSNLKSEKARTALCAFQSVVTFLLFMLVTWWAIRLVGWAAQVKPKTSTFDIPLIIAYILMTFSFALSTVYQIKNIYSAIMDMQRAFSDKKEG